MKERRTFKQYEGDIQVSLLVIIAIALFSAGFFVGWSFMEKPLSENQFELCEQIARDVYEQKRQVIVEAPEDFSVNVSTTTITVSSSYPFFRGKVLATLQNGELVMTRSLETGDAVFISILMGILFVLLAILLVMLIKKIQKRKQRNPK